MSMYVDFAFLKVPSDHIILFHTLLRNCYLKVCWRSRCSRSSRVADQLSIDDSWGASCHWGSHILAFGHLANNALEVKTVLGTQALPTEVKQDKWHRDDTFSELAGGGGGAT